jgi:hypothetical protein
LHPAGSLLLVQFLLTHFVEVKRWQVRADI